MASRYLGIGIAALCLALAACNAGGRPKNVKPVAEPVIAAPAVNPAEFGKEVGGDYIVAPGDTLAVVADRTNTPIRSLIDMNNLQPPYGLAPGTRLALKQRSQYVVQAEDTLPDLASRYGVTESALVSINNLQPPYVLQPGQRLMIPSASEASSLPAMTAEAVPPPPSPTGTVAATPLPSPSAPMPSPTVSTNASPSVSAQPLPAPTVSQPVGSQPVVSQPVVTPLPAPSVATPTVKQPGATETAALPAPKPLPATPTPTVKAEATPAPAAVTAKPATPAASDVATEAATTAAEAEMESAPAAGSGKGAFVWPVQGKVIGAFGSSKDGLKNDGINIAAPSGAPVLAAADGVVAYAGNELRGFGNMILLRHDGGFVTAYAHNASLLVKKGDKVKRGQTIARVGATGAVFGPQLHFEIRKGTQPVDPMTYLGG